MPVLQTRCASRRLLLGMAALAFVVGTLLTHQLSHDAGSVTAGSHHAVSAIADPGTAAPVTHLGTAPAQPASPGHSADELVPACVAILASALGTAPLIGSLPSIEGLPRPPPRLVQVGAQGPLTHNVSTEVLDAKGVLRV